MRPCSSTHHLPRTIHDARALTGYVVVAAIVTSKVIFVSPKKCPIHQLPPKTSILSLFGSMMMYRKKYLLWVVAVRICFIGQGQLEHLITQTAEINGNGLMFDCRSLGQSDSSQANDIHILLLLLFL